MSDETEDYQDDFVARKQQVHDFIYEMQAAMELMCEEHFDFPYLPE